MTIRIGIIAEDQSDIDVVREILKLKVKKFGIDQFLGKGCGKIKGKCRSWANDLKARGCSRLIVLHDADNNQPNALKADLAGALGQSPISKHVIAIPVRELEAWLLADESAIKKGLNLREALKKIANPEAIQRPKERLRDLVYRASEKKITYLNTVHNKRIAAHLSIKALNRCTSFTPLHDFIEKNL